MLYIIPEAQVKGLCEEGNMSNKNIIFTGIECYGIKTILVTAD